MTFIKLSLKNLKSNLKNYAMYFMSMTFVLMIYFMFGLIRFNSDFYSSLYSSGFQQLFPVVSIAIGLFALLFIWYSNGFFTKKRSKEMALYALLGMERYQISLMFITENVLMGMLSLITAFLLGSLLSKFLMMTLLKIMQHSITVGFALPWEAFIGTVKLLLLILVVTTLHNTFIIRKTKLIKLFRADDTGENAPKFSWFLSILSIAFICIGYMMALNMREATFGGNFPLTYYAFFLMLFVCSGTYLFFRNLVIALLNLIRKKESYYHKSMNLITFSSLYYRIRGHVLMLSMICLLLATTLGAFGFGYSTYYSNKVDSKQQSPFSYVFKFSQDEATYNASTVETLLERKEDTNAKTHLIEVKETNGQWGEDIILISESNFNSLRESMNLPKVAVPDNQVLYAYPSWLENVDPNKGEDYLLQDGSTLTISDVDQQTYFHMFIAMLVLKDNAYTRFSAPIATYTTVSTPSPLTEKEGYNAIRQDENLKDSLINSRYESYYSSLQSSGILLFMCGFLGFVFLIATGSIIYFKQTAECDKDAKHYNMLYKLGVDKRDMKKSIYKQMGFIFGGPCILALLHNLFAQICMSKLLNTQLWVPLFITSAVFLLVYGVYYLLTVHTFYKRVTQSF